MAFRDRNYWTGLGGVPRYATLVEEPSTRSRAIKRWCSACGKPTDVTPKQWAHGNAVILCKRCTP